MAEIVVGIDLGTTFSAAAYVNDKGNPTVIPNAAGQTTTPSVVLVRNGHVVVGELAMNRWITDEEHVCRWIKRAMGDLDYRFQGFSPIQISAEILKALKADAGDYLKQPIEEAVITCPAYFDALEVENTKKAGELAGFRVREIVKEPTAAAVYYGVEQMREGEKVLVCDLGGGTYDATVLTLEGGCFRPLACMGGRELGGHDWTMELVDMVAQRLFALRGDDPRYNLLTKQALYEACETAKRSFTHCTEVTIPCQCRGASNMSPFPGRSSETANEGRMAQLIAWSEEALGKASLGWRDVDTILLVGGSSRLRQMSDSLEKASGKRPVAVNNPDLAVALGAAILARGQVYVRRSAAGLVDASGGLVDIDYESIIPQNLGTRVIDLASRPRISNALIIPHSTPAPVTRSRDDFEVVCDGQSFFDIPVVEFEDEDRFRTIRNYRCRCLPNAAKGDRIVVTFHYDKSAIITVDAKDAKTGRALLVDPAPYEEPDLAALLRVAPRWVVFALDVSTSMRGQKINNAKRALGDSARGLLAQGHAGWRVGVVVFGSAAAVCCRPTADLATLVAAVDAIGVSGSTAMDEGIVCSLDLVAQVPREADRDIVLVTDGMPDDDRTQSTLDAASLARSQGVTLSVLGIGSDNVDESFLQQMTPLTLRIDSPAGIEQGLATLLARSLGAHQPGLPEHVTRWDRSKLGITMSEEIQTTQIQASLDALAKQVSFLPPQLRMFGDKIDGLTMAISDTRCRALLSAVVAILGMVEDMLRGTADPAAVACDHGGNYDLLRTQLRQLLEANGLVEIAAEGPFDPRWHRAVQRVHCDDPADHNRILAVMRPGFRTPQAVLRYADVKVGYCPLCERAGQTTTADRASAEGGGPSGDPGDATTEFL